MCTPRQIGRSLKDQRRNTHRVQPNITSAAPAPAILRKHFRRSHCNMLATCLHWQRATDAFDLSLELATGDSSLCHSSLSEGAAMPYDLASGTDSDGSSASDADSDSSGARCAGFRIFRRAHARVALGVEDPKARLAQEYQLKADGVYRGAQKVRTELTCIQQWLTRDNELLLHKDCISYMIADRATEVILMDPEDLEVRAVFADAGRLVGKRKHVDVAIRVPKNDTQEKESKEEKKKVLGFPKFRYSSAQTGVSFGGKVEVEGVHLGWILAHAGPDRGSPITHIQSPRTPSQVNRRAFYAAADEGHGEAEPLDWLTEEDLKDGPEDPYYKVTLKQRDSQSWPFGAAALRTFFEACAVYIFTIYLGSEPDEYYLENFQQPWNMASNGRFKVPWPFVTPERWRAPGSEYIFQLFWWTFLAGLLLKVFLASSWHLFDRSRLVRHILAAVYPLAITVPLNLYLLYWYAALTNCRQCAEWHCGAYNSSIGWNVDAAAFQQAGGCGVSNFDDLLQNYSRFVRRERQQFEEAEACEYSTNGAIVNYFFHANWNFSLQGGACGGNGYSSKEWVLVTMLDSLCGIGTLQPLLLKGYVDPPSGKDLPWWMFAGSIPGKKDNCSVLEGEAAPSFSSYVFYRASEKDAYTYGSVCLCEDARGHVHCIRKQAGSVDRCMYFTGQRVLHGPNLEFETVASGLHIFPAFEMLLLPIFAFISMAAWAQIPLGSLDKTDERLITKSQLEILDVFLFFLGFIVQDQSDSTLSTTMFVPRFTSLSWLSLVINVWSFAWVTLYLSSSLQIFCRVLDADPDKTPKTWRDVKAILRDLEHAVARGEGFGEKAEHAASVPSVPSVASVASGSPSVPFVAGSASGWALARAAARKQLVVYEKEIQKRIKRGSSIWLQTDKEEEEEDREDGEDRRNKKEKEGRKKEMEKGRKEQEMRMGETKKEKEKLRSSTCSECSRWRKWTIVWSPKVKDLNIEEDCPVTLYVTGAWPWSTCPADVWCCQSVEEYLQMKGLDGLADLPHGVRRLDLRYSELSQVMATSGYTCCDCRYLGWLGCCKRQPRFEWKKIKEEDPRISCRHPGGPDQSDIYYDKAAFHWFERNLEYFNMWRGVLCLEIPFGIVRAFDCMFLGGFSNTFNVILLIKNIAFTIFSIAYCMVCGNPRLTCGPCWDKPVELISKCIVNTKIGSVIKLSVLMPVRIVLEALSCLGRESAESRMAEYEMQLRMATLQMAKGGSNQELRHRRRLLSALIRQYGEWLEVTDVRSLMKVRKKVRVKDFI
ncbi:unnamed protein product [Effrenium voratum]|uniref:Uncharacterized protein n=1 Tax=Effrenium voratum TaxID=2562239 RepID=A0AA36IEF6_9DINO|nr:unnamed protein product [Effrenium voratum]CAJ1420689.1 unnamed protein product [Effrenium voratum]